MTVRVLRTHGRGLLELVAAVLEEREMVIWLKAIRAVLTKLQGVITSSRGMLRVSCRQNREGSLPVRIMCHDKILPSARIVDVLKKRS
jgi:hypothetical protein